MYLIVLLTVIVYFMLEYIYYKKELITLDKIILQELHLLKEELERP